MLKEKDVVEKVEKIANPIVEGEGLSIYDVEFKREPQGWVLRVFICRERGNVSIDDCVKVSRQLNVLLDVEDVIEHAYHLEVSSPGLTRSLKKIRHFEKSINSVVKIKTKEPIDGEKVFKGTIVDVSSNIVTVKSGEKEFKVDFENILNAKLELDI